MTKVIRIKDETFDSLINTAKWSDTMDEIIKRRLQQTGTSDYNKKIKSQDNGRQTISCEQIRGH